MARALPHHDSPRPLLFCCCVIATCTTSKPALRLVFISLLRLRSLSTQCVINPPHLQARAKLTRAQSSLISSPRGINIFIYTANSSHPPDPRNPRKCAPHLLFLRSLRSRLPSKSPSSMKSRVSSRRPARRYRLLFNLQQRLRQSPTRSHLAPQRLHS